MKIGFLTPEFPHPRISQSGGIGTSILNLSNGLIHQGHEVIVIVYGQDEDAIFEENGIVFYKVSNIKFIGISRYLTQKKLEKLINKLVLEEKIDILEVPDWGTNSFIKIMCPLVIRLHGTDTYFCHLDNRPVKWNNHFQEKKALKNADAIISVSQFTGDLTNKLFETNWDFTVIPNCIDVQNFIFDENNNSFEDTILYFGTLVRKKGLLELPFIFNEVYKNNNNAKLVLVGRDNPDVITGKSSTWELMQELFSAESKKNVSYLGSVPYSEIKNQIEQATLCVFPTFAEALPVSWIEAMAMQKAIVASNIGWASEIVSDGVDGFLVNPKNHTDFANKIIVLLKDKDLRNNVGTTARNKIIKKFNIDIVASQNVAFYEKVINSKK